MQIFELTLTFSLCTFDRHVDEIEVPFRATNLDVMDLLVSAPFAIHARGR